MQAAFVHSEHVAENIYSYWFKPDKPLRYTAGQFTEIKLPHEHADGRGDTRWFTLSSAPTEELLAITTKIDPEKGSSFKRALAALKPGESVSLAEPMGDFVLPKALNIPIVFVAGGVGITPVRSMIRSVIDTEETRPLHLLYAVRSTKQLAFRELFEQAPLLFEPIIHARASLNTQRIMELPQVKENALVYISGPEHMTEALYKDLLALGIPQHRLVTDYFHGYPEA